MRGARIATMAMTIRARVRNGRLIVDQPTDLPDGTELELALVESRDELDEEDRARLQASLEAADEELRAGKGLPGEQIIAALRRGEM
jgi:hypothetical protein